MTQDASPAHADRDLAGLASVDLNLLVPLMALLEESSVTHAADRVRLSQPAMSHALRRLRKLLGDELLVRQGGTMLLTPRAQELVDPVRRALAEAVRALTSASFDPLTDERTVTIALTASTAFVLGPLLRRLLDERAPHMTLKLRTADVNAPGVFTADGVDVVLLTEGLRAPHPRERLYDDRWVVIASAETPEGCSALELLRTEPHIKVDAEALQLRPYDALDRAGVEYTVKQTVSDYLLVPHFLREIRGVGLHRLQVVAEFVRRDPLRILPFPFPIAPLGIDMVWNPWLTDDTYREWLRELLLEAATPLRVRARQRADELSHSFHA